MKFCIKEWSTNTIVLMTENGNVLSYFNSISEALDACAEWYNTNSLEQKYEVTIQYRQDAGNYDSVIAMAS